MTLLINYANAEFRKSQQLNSQTGRDVGKFDEVISYSPQDIDAEFRERNKHILKQVKGNGYWLWKPYFIHRALQQLRDGDILFYSDSGAYFTADVAPLTDLLDRSGRDLVVFELQQIEKHWTKRDAFILMDCDSPEFTDTKQRLATFSIWRKSKFTMDLIEEYLELAQDERLITDLENQCGQPNDPEFKNHRHDQSIFSLLSKKHGIEAHRDPSQWGDDVRELYPNSPYPSVIHSTRASHPSLFRKLVNKVKKRLNKK